MGTILARNAISLADGASLWGAALSEASVTLDSASIVLGREGVLESYTFSQSTTQSQTASATVTQTHSSTIYQVSVNMLSAKTFSLLAATALSNTVRVPLGTALVWHHGHVS